MCSFVFTIMLNKLSIKEAHDGLVKKDFTSVELAKACFDSIREKDEQVNAFITITEDKAYQQAELVDKKINSGKEIGLLEGIPIAIKDNILVKDVKATAGSKILANYVAPYNSTVVNKLKKAGAVIIGKTNLDEFAMGGSGETSNFGPTKNPHDLTKVPGGSSSGSAASVAADETVCAIGSDTGGSVRLPASFCGVVGLKPTYGRVSRHGLMAMASSFDAIGPLTKNVSDAALLLETISGIDKFDSTTVDRKFNFTEHLKRDIKGMKIGIPKEYFSKGIDPQVEKQVKEAVKKFELLGAQIVEVSLPMTKYALSSYYILMPAEVSSNMARYDGVRYGYRADSGNLLEMYLKTRREGLGEEVRRRIMLGTYVLSSGYYDAYYKKAQQVRALIKQDLDKVFKLVDVLVAPTSPTVAYGLGEKMDDPLTMYLSDIFTVSANVSGVPAISIPCGKVNDLPVGLQIIGNYFDEAKILNLAYQFENNLK
ncbi:Asp-tRNA(Asn)/Glu-tRNA(Gln) amidotransferase subunit GatA [Candidatus Falkowbacteria bacterium]|nr:Asp-tRNA(Asn)/Glu-tRNA(Gln) amidotransferase subunit GatA [Candidatus Falkowbacteria bacterium]MBT7007078.1 Asp-tRNA(Asn)/Glu-tRNA(Gln) amidotransferase subunit GatA [Candidatus Falkowbacteria bacterium]